jgi:N-sulfoglucosamine sulfohydrolase
MKRRTLLTGSGALAPAFLGSAADAPINVLYVHSHDTGRYIQPYGHAVPTPNLQKLAEEGVLFRQAFNAAPTCSPSRSCLLTGYNAHSNGMLGLAHRGFSLNDPSQHLAAFLGRAGYVTGVFGVQHVMPKAREREIGYTYYRNENAGAPNVAARAVEFIKSRPKQPFFIDAGFHETHRKFAPATHDQDVRYTLPPTPIPDTPQTRRDMAEFKASAKIMDDAVGAILAALEQTGQAANTLVISTTDHGVPFPEMKCNLTDHGMGVLLTLRGPGVLRGGKVIDAMVSHLDLYPTICELLKLDPPNWLEGKSLIPLVAGTTNSIRDQVVAEVNYHAAYEPKRAVRTARWKYIKRFDGRGHPNLPNCDDGLSKSLWLDNGWRERQVPTESLFDLMFDPAERHNVAGDAASLHALAEMRGRLDRWMKATNDPLLHGSVAAPSGAVVNDPNGTSPGERPTPVSAPR